MRISGAKRKLLAVAFLTALAFLAWYTMDSGKFRLLVIVLLGGFGVRIVLTADRSRDGERAEDRH